VFSGCKTLTTQVRCHAGAVPTSYPTGTNSVKRTDNETYTSRPRMCGVSPPCCLPILTAWCLRTGTACQWRNLIRRSGIAGGITMRRCTVPLDPPCVSGFATDSSGESFMCSSEKHHCCTSDRSRQLHLESSEHETSINWRPVCVIVLYVRSVTWAV